FGDIGQAAAVNRHVRLQLVVGALGDLRDTGPIGKDSEDVEGLRRALVGVRVADAVAIEVDVFFVGSPVRMLIQGRGRDVRELAGRVQLGQQNGLTGDGGIAGGAGAHAGQHALRQPPSRNVRRQRIHVTPIDVLVCHAGGGRPARVHKGIVEAPRIVVFRVRRAILGGYDAGGD